MAISYIVTKLHYARFVNDFARVDCDSQNSLGHRKNSFGRFIDAWKKEFRHN